MASRQAIGESTAAWKARGGGQMTVASRTSTSGVSSATRRQVSSLFAEAKKIYEPGGGYMAGTEAGIARGSKRAVASGVQQLASAGLAGTSIVGGLGKKYEEEIGMPIRQQATTARLGALAGLLQAEAGATASLATRYSTSPVSYGGGGGGGGGRIATPRRTAAQPSTATRPQPLPAFNQPTLKAPKREPTGYRGIFFGADFYKRQQQQPQTASTVSGGDLMRQADKYDLSGMYF